MIRLFRVLRLKRELSRSLAARKLEHNRRSEAAKQGVSAHWRKAGEQARALFGELA